MQWHRLAFGRLKCQQRRIGFGKHCKTPSNNSFMA
jgi:hypothetical protein